jgi:hypothetical protein
MSTRWLRLRLSSSRHAWFQPARSFLVERCGLWDRCVSFLHASAIESVEQLDDRCIVLTFLFASSASAGAQGSILVWSTSIRWLAATITSGSSP